MSKQMFKNCLIKLPKIKSIKYDNNNHYNPDKLTIKTIKTTDRETKPNTTQNSHDKTKADANNKTTHTKNGNINATKILQLNSSHADFHTKIHELISTIVTNDAAVTIVSEANIEHDDARKVEERKGIFKNYKIEEKTVNGQSKSRIAVILRKDLAYERLYHLESINNSTIIIKAKICPRKSVIIVGSYHE